MMYLKEPAIFELVDTIGSVLKFYRVKVISDNHQKLFYVPTLWISLIDIWL